LEIGSTKTALVYGKPEWVLRSKMMRSWRSLLV
jgi:hypothetical protein